MDVRNAAPAICGVDCSRCGWRASCGGCAATGGRPFGGDCMLASCCRSRGQRGCRGCGDGCRLRAQLLAEFNALGIADLPPVTELFALRGALVNLPYRLPDGQTVKLWEDDRIYLGNQIPRQNGRSCYGLCADESHLLVSEYREGGADAEIVLYRRRERRE